MDAPRLRSIAIVTVDNQDLQTDARVLRQIEHLGPHYNLDVVAYGREDIRKQHPLRSLHLVGSLFEGRKRRQIRSVVMLAAGRVLGSWLYERWYWGRPGHREALALLRDMDVQAIHANDWWSLPIAAEAVGKRDILLVQDLHEYGPEELDNHLWWRVLYKPVVHHFLRKYLKRSTASVTINALIAERYRKEWGIDPIVVRNVPAVRQEPVFRPIDPARVRLIHHGAATRDRELDRMIRAMQWADPRFHLTLMLLGDERNIRDLKRLAAELVPDRVDFVPAVRPKEVVARLTEFDLGVYLLPTRSFNNQAATPNKFFDFVAAGLGICIGPSPEMARLIRQYDNGAVSASYEPREFAELLNRLGTDDIHRMKRHSIAATRELNDKVEMKKLVDLYARLGGLVPDAHPDRP
jgi:hypothetical protein